MPKNPRRGGAPCVSARVFARRVGCRVPCLGLCPVLFLGALLAITTIASPARAVLTIDLEWTATTGSGAIGSNTIAAEPGDELTLDIIATVDGAGVDQYSLSVEFDFDGGDELDLVETFEFSHEAVIPCDPLIEEQLGELPACFDNFGPELVNLSQGIASETESSAGQPGLAEGFEAATTKAGPDAGPTNLSFRVGRIVFRVTENVTTDGDDIEGSLISAIDGYADNAGNAVFPEDLPDPALVPGFAAVDVPEPSAAVLAGAALATLVGLRRTTRRRVARARTQ